MKVLVGCEESGVVRNAFTAKGHNAWSCDLLPSRSEGQHLQMDIFKALNHSGAYEPWDIIILHPDCTKLAVSGNAHYGEGKLKNQERIDALNWTTKLWQEACALAHIGVCLENPVGILSNDINFHKPQYIQPYNYGHNASKKTGLWLWNLPKLKHKPEDYIAPRIVMGLPRWANQTDSGQNNLTPHENRKRDRSETYTGIANAMAEQWSA